MEVPTMTFGSMDQFQLDLTDEQKRLCDWVAQQASTGILRIRYEDARAALDVPEEQLTWILRKMRERRDGIHEIVESPILNTQTPYFDVPLQARDIWDGYRRAEQRVAPAEAPQVVLQQFAASR
jgi:hypothetical protein